MSVKRFVAADMRRALELVKQEVGPEAVILSSRRVKQGVEILTSLEPQAANPEKPSPVDSTIAGVDVPMGSDGSWKDQLAVEQAVAKNAARVIGEDQGVVGSAASSALPAVDAQSGPGLGLASGKTPQQLANDIEQARNRMLASRKAQSALEQPISRVRSVSGADQVAENGMAQHETAPVRDFVDEPAFASESDAFTESTAMRGRGFADHDLQRESFQQQHDQQQKLDALQVELADMRLLLEQQLSKIARAPRFDSPVQSALMRRLQQMGIVDDVAQQLVSDVRSLGSLQDAWTETLALLSRQLPSDSSNPVMRGGVFALVGPTGVGKTTTLAKLAARYVLEHGAEQVTLVSTDTHRIAAQEQLKSMGRIMGVQVKIVDDHNDLSAVLRSLKHCPLVLIDTAGFRNGDALLTQQLRAIQEIPSVQTLLVMAANSQYQTLKATMHAHKPDRLAGCILTKLDETANLGEALSCLVEHRLSLMYTTDGQEIPQDIQGAKAHQVVARAVGLMKQAQAYSQGAGAAIAQNAATAVVGAPQDMAEQLY